MALLTPDLTEAWPDIEFFMFFYGHGQIILGILGVVSGANMLKLWKYVVLGAVIIGAILTPSTDPITQILLSGAIVLLYCLGAGVLILLKR